jgi:hypothetical protein
LSSDHSPCQNCGECTVQERRRSKHFQPQLQGRILSIRLEMPARRSKPYTGRKSKKKQSFIWYQDAAIEHSRSIQHARHLSSFIPSLVRSSSHLRLGYSSENLQNPPSLYCHSSPLSIDRSALQPQPAHHSFHSSLPPRQSYSTRSRPRQPEPPTQQPHA